MPKACTSANFCVFEPEAILAMSTAFELSCADLHIFQDDQRSREIIVTRSSTLRVTA